MRVAFYCKQPSVKLSDIVKGFYLRISIFFLTFVAIAINTKH